MSSPQSRHLTMRSCCRAAEEVGGRYCENCHVSDVVADDVRLGPLGEGVRGYALDPENAKALWKKSEELVGEAFA